MGLTILPANATSSPSHPQTQWSRLIEMSGTTDSSGKIYSKKNRFLSEVANDVTSDSQGNIYATGVIEASAWDAYVGVSFIARYDGAGNKLWSKLFGNYVSDSVIGRLMIEDDIGIYVADTPNHVISKKITADIHGNIYIAGEIKDSLNGENKYAFIAKYDSLGNRLWERYLNDNARPTWVESITSDPQGNVYAIGPYANTYEHVYTFIAKYDGDGNIQWTKHAIDPQIQKTSVIFGKEITSDSQGNLYITGETEVISSEGKKVSNLFLTKYDKNGNTLYTKFLGNVGPGVYIDGFYNLPDTSGHGITCDSQGYIYIVGETNGNGLDNLAQIKNDPSAFIIKYDGNGNVLWTRLIDGSDDPYTIASDSQGNVYMTGNLYTYKNSTFDGQTVTYGDAFVIKYDATGRKLWTKLLDAEMSLYRSELHDSGTTRPTGLAIDLIGNIYVVGHSTDEALAGPYNSFIVKYDQNQF
ncbi:SBBP repeat-containing protein [Leptospira semungkisensis]|uniref:SBBP repeat-containing protein n=1 Tax=Leptospira semungkisensis TaxID=2484985 RepID=UPI0014386552|nr:SBBP repeat-containing protein [Leptospira semungkisensis]